MKQKSKLLIVTWQNFAHLDQFKRPDVRISGVGIYFNSLRTAAVTIHVDFCEFTLTLCLWNRQKWGKLYGTMYCGNDSYWGCVHTIKSSDLFDFINEMIIVLRLYRIRIGIKYQLYWEILMLIFAKQFLNHWLTY